MRREAKTLSWYSFACTYVDATWADNSPHHRRGIAEVLTATTTALLADRMPEVAGSEMAVRSALRNWAFNTPRRTSASIPEQVRKHLEWVENASPALQVLEDPTKMRELLSSFSVNINNKRAAPRTAAWRRSVLSTALELAVHEGHLSSNPVTSSKRKAPKAPITVDRRCVVNPAQARLLLKTVDTTPRSGKRMTAFFGSMYYAGARPEEAAALTVADLDLPAEGWGWIHLSRAAPEIDRQWSDTDTRRQKRSLKHRPEGETRIAPSPPALTALLHEHIKRGFAAKDGRLFIGERGEQLAGVSYNRLWQRARAAALTADQAASPLGHRPYDLRHACVSTWLNGGVAPTQVAEWAGHSVAVLLRIYAKCLDGQVDANLRRIEDALGG
jgi:integrase